MTKRLEHKVSFRLGSDAWRALEALSKSLKEEIGSVARKHLTAELLRVEVKKDLTTLLSVQNSEFQDFKKHLETLFLKHNLSSHSRRILRVLRSKTKRIESRYPAIENLIVELNKNMLGALDSLRELLINISGRQEKLASVLGRLCDVIDELKHEVERIGA